LVEKAWCFAPVKRYEAKANFWRLRPRPRPKIIMKKVASND